MEANHNVQCKTQLCYYPWSVELWLMKCNGMLAIPILSHGKPFLVLLVLTAQTLTDIPLIINILQMESQKMAK